MRRTATVGRLAAGETVKRLGTKAANVGRSEQGAQEANARRQLETAKQIVAALGTMKGAAMKLGQVMSFLDVGLVPEEHREEFQRELSKLRDAAPIVSFKQMKRVIEDDLEEEIADVFAEFDEEPIAAASIGQVYRARLKDGPSRGHPMTRHTLKGAGKQAVAARSPSRSSIQGWRPRFARTCRTLG